MVVLSHPGLKAEDSSTQVREPQCSKNNLARLAIHFEGCARRMFNLERELFEVSLR